MIYFAYNSYPLISLAWVTLAEIYALASKPHLLTGAYKPGRHAEVRGR
jgi:hypothetical protein